MGNVIIFDTETTGFYHFDKPVDHPVQPHIVQLSAILMDSRGGYLNEMDVIVNPGVPIPVQASAIHGITDKVARQSGISPEEALRQFSEMLHDADEMVAHNLQFDEAVLRAAYKRIGRRPRQWPSRSTCTMRAATHVVNLPPTPAMLAKGMDSPKAPKLEECIQHFFGEGLDGAHDAGVDTRACARVYLHLLEKNLV